jgi:hypothetical protein
MGIDSIKFIPFYGDTDRRGWHYGANKPEVSINFQLR